MRAVRQGDGIPYISAGVNENDLSDLDTYFATTLTYAEQAPLLASQLQAQSFTEIGLVVMDQPSFDDALEAIKAAVEEAGITIAFETRIDDRGRVGTAFGRPGAEEQRRRGRGPAQLAPRVHRPGRPGAHPRLHAGLARARRHEWTQRGHHVRLPGGRPASSSHRRQDSTSSTRSTRISTRRTCSSAAGRPPTTSASSCGR